MRHVDLKLLRVFTTIVESGGFSEAEEVLNISQPSISKCIHDLELRTGFILCTRGRKGFSLTSEGVLFYEQCVILRNSVEKFLNTTSRISAKRIRELRIGIMADVGSWFSNILSGAISDFQASHGNLSFTVDALDPNATIKGIQESRFDAGITVFRANCVGLSRLRLYTETASLHARGDILENPGEVTLAAAQARLKAVGRSYGNNEDIRSLGVETVDAHVNGIYAAFVLINGGTHFGLLPDQYVKEHSLNGELIRIPNCESIQAPVYGFYRTEDRDTTVAEFLALLQSRCNRAPG